ncbi:AMP-binding protein [Phreatobacter sp.]|uniref:phenylacetate--CoA ligase family protein n=1 Tax=Phreatobacter sp. TaxID=1966341 RepID=UPI002600FC14|nr:AMP-binding protein [Phreatobacter sp.]
MAGHYDKRETRDDAAREKDLMKRLPQVLTAAMKVPAWRRHLGKIDPRGITSRAALAELPIQRKADLPALQKAALPFGGFVPGKPSAFGRLFMSPGPIFEPEAIGHDVWRVGRAMAAAGFKRGDIVLNTLSYHLTPGAWCFDSGARAVGCAVIPAGPGNTEAQLDLIEAYRPSAYAGVPDFLKILLDAAREKGRDASSIKRALVGGAAFPASLQKEIASRGVDAYQTYAIAECGVIAYETAAREGLVLNEDIILEIVRPGTGDPVTPGEVGEVVITVLDPHHPLIRFAVGDLTAILPGASPCGRTNTRIKGWMGRADQTAKVKGMFVRPEQVAEVIRRHPEIARARLVVARNGETDAMTLKVESRARSPEFVHAVGESLQAILKLKGTVEPVKPGSLPNDGKVIEDTRPVG